MVIPYGTAGKVIVVPHLGPILVITVWDVICLLWTHYINFPPRTASQNQTTYLMKMLELLAEQIFKMEETVLARPSAVNLTISKRRGRVLKYLFGASIRCGTGNRVEIESINKKIAETRVRMMPRLFSNVPTNQEFENCRQAWGNCSELVPIATLYGQWKPQRRRAVLYSRTINLKSMKTVPPCVKCQLVINSLAPRIIRPL